MTIEIAVPPKTVDRRTYKRIIEKVVEADGQWLRVTLDEVAPDCPVHVKQSRLWQAASTRGFKIQTTVQEGAIFIRLRKVGG
jgi:hypothetical protein